jgi:hypothetical protein
VCDYTVRFDYTFWNVTNPAAWRAGTAPPALDPVGPFSFTAREARWNVSFSADGTAVSYSSTFYHAAFDRDASCAACDLDGARIVSINRGYLAALAGSGGSELPWLLPGVPATLGGVLAGAAAGLKAAMPGLDDATATALAARQWWACDVWPPTPPSPGTGPFELCAHAVTAGRPLPELGDEGAAALLSALLGDPAAVDAMGSDPAARTAALFFGLAPPPAIAATTGLSPTDAESVQSYLRAFAAAWVGPAFEAAFLGMPLGPASGGLLVARPARAWIEGWPDPLLAAVLPGGPANPAATISAALAFPSLDAPALRLGKPLASLSFRDHPAIATYTLTTGKPTEDVDAASKRFLFTATEPGTVLEMNGQAVVAAYSGVTGDFTFPGPDPANPAAALGGPIPLAGAALAGAAFAQKVAGRGEPLRLFDGGLGRPMTARPAGPGALGRADSPRAQALAGTTIVRRRGGKAVTVNGIDAVVYGLDAGSTAACDAAAGATAGNETAIAAAARAEATANHRCAFPDPAAWTWNASLVYGTPTLLGLPRWAGAPPAVAAGGGPTLANSPPAAAGAATPPEAAWWFGVEPFSGLTVAASKPVQVAHRVAPTDGLYPALWTPPGGDGLDPGAGPGGWVPSHWATASFAADIPPMRAGLRIVWAMRVILSYTVPAAALAVGCGCAWALVGSARATETRAALNALRRSRAPPTELTKEEVAGLLAAAVAELEEAGGG